MTVLTVAHMILVVGILAGTMVLIICGRPHREPPISQRALEALDAREED